MSKHTPGPWRILEIEPWNDSGAMWFKAPEGHDGIKSSGHSERCIEIKSETKHMADIFGSAEGGHIAEVPMTYDGRDQALANARLLAAAPALFEGCETLEDEDRLRAFAEDCRNFPNEPILHLAAMNFPELFAALGVARGEGGQL